MRDEEETFIYAVQDHLNTYIKAADQKASILLTAQLAFLGLFSNAFRLLISDAGTIFSSFALLSAVAGLVGIFLSGWVVFPRTAGPDSGGGFFYWEDILEFSTSSAYEENLSDLTDEELREELASENYVLAEITQEKYRFLRWSLEATAVMVVASVITAGIYLG